LKLDLTITRWDCWAPGCEDAAAWCKWSQGQVAPSGEGQPDLPHIKPMLRRRLSPLARAAFHAADSCMGQIDNPACVFSSTYGQPEQTLQLLQTLAREEPLSPTAFSLSVHNAVAGLFSIIHKLTGPSLTVSAGSEGIGAAFLEAAGLLAEGESNVLVVCFEAALPEVQRPFEENPPTIMAACYLVTATTSGSTALQLQRTPVLRTSRTSKAAPFWQQTRDLIGFLESGAETLEIPCRRCTWLWSRPLACTSARKRAT
jgi:hypothetical protein